MLSKRDEEILQAVYFYRYVTAQDVAHLFFSERVITRVREILNVLAGGDDDVRNQYLYRFKLPNTEVGNKQKVFTLGSRGRDFLEEQLGLPADWYFRPDKVKHLSFNFVAHSLLLTRVLVAANRWAASQADFRLIETRISYELAKVSPSVRIPAGRKTVAVSVIPDAWLLFEKLENGAHAHFFPVLLEIDRGTEFQQRFKQHIQARIEFIRSGAYRQLFGQQAVVIAYVTTGDKDRPDYLKQRLASMRAWTNQVLTDLNRPTWARVFRFCALSMDEVYGTPLFSEPVWFRPDEPDPVTLFASEVKV
jgi:hypothetical protein